LLEAWFRVAIGAIDPPPEIDQLDHDPPILQALLE
jgi:hypothetical protein